MDTVSGMAHRGPSLVRVGTRPRAWFGGVTIETARVCVQNSNGYERLQGPTQGELIPIQSY